MRHLTKNGEFIVLKSSCVLGTAAKITYCFFLERIARAVGTADEFSRTDSSSRSNG